MKKKEKYTKKGTYNYRRCPQCGDSLQQSGHTDYKARYYCRCGYAAHEDIL